MARDNLDKVDPETVVKGHAIIDAIHGMSFEQLDAVSKIVQLIVVSGSDADRTANFYSGLIKNVLHMNFNVCMLCDKIHTDDEENGGDDKDHTHGQYL